METKLLGPQWYALYTRPRWEKKVAELLTEMEIKNYCPLNRVVRQWSDRKKIVFEPLFTSYVFVNASEKQHSEIRRINGIINFVYWLNKPAVIREEEINYIKKFLNEHENVRVQTTPICLNDAVRVIRGPLMECEGSIITIKSKTVKIALPSLGCIMFAEVEKENVERISVKVLPV